MYPPKLFECVTRSSEILSDTQKILVWRVEVTVNFKSGGHENQWNSRRIWELQKNSEIFIVFTRDWRWHVTVDGYGNRKICQFCHRHRNRHRCFFFCFTVTVTVTADFFLFHRHRHRRYGESENNMFAISLATLTQSPETISQIRKLIFWYTRDIPFLEIEF